MMTAFKEAVVALVAVLRVGHLQNIIDMQFDLLAEMGDYAQGEYSGKNEGYSKALTEYKNSADKALCKFGKDVLDAAQKGFCELTLAEQNELWGITAEIEEPQKVFDEILLVAKNLVQSGYQDDDFSLWLSAADDVLFGTQPKQELTMLCSCGSYLEKVPAEEVGLQKGYVYRCPDCGNYALMGSDSIIVGIAADAPTHDVRNKSYLAIKNLCDCKGITQREALRAISRKIKVSLRNLSDIEFLDIDKCKELLGYVLQNTIFAQPEELPHNYEEMMQFFKNGGRFLVQRSLSPKRCGKLFIPVAVIKNAVIVKGEDGNERFLMPDVLEYQFEDNIVTIKHPTQTENLILFAPFKG